jgi:hypothetical protein
MIAQSISAVVLPAGLGASGRPRANVYLSPRLSGAHLLTDFPDWRNWTQLVHDHGLRVDLAAGGNTASVQIDMSALRPDMWEAIFADDSLVEEYARERFDDRVVVSYPSRDAHEYLRFAYQRAATTDPGVASRTLEVLLGDLVFRDEGGKSTLDETLSRLRVELWRAQKNGNGAGNGTPPPTLAAMQARVRPMAERFALYHRLPPAPNRPPLPSTPEELRKLIDFHQALTSLAAYPSLLPPAGLVFPVELPNGLLAGSPSGGQYRDLAVAALHPGWGWSHAPTIVTPRTAYVLGADDFAAAPATAPAAGRTEPGDVVDGFLVLSEQDFHLVAVDLDGALLKAMALADSLANASDWSRAEGLLPSLRSSGISLLADGRAQELLRAIRDNAAFDDPGTRPLDARDLTRGYRLDVLDGGDATWRSLHRRDGTYVLGGGSVTIQTTDEEGFTQLAVVQPAPDSTRPTDKIAAAAGAPQPSTDLYLNERIARWNGWSLSAPRPGKPINRSPDPAEATADDPTAGEPTTTFAMSTSFVARPGTLPSLRFGHRYRVRARAVDLAGGSADPTADGPGRFAAPAGGFLSYYRYEPVGPPIVVLRTLPGSGGSLHELVIRTFNSDPSLDAVPVGDSEERHVAPSAAGEQLVERHGMLDDPDGRLRGDGATYQFLVDRDRGTIPTVGDDPIEQGPQLGVGYLPDPLARGAVFSDLPHTKPNTDGTIVGGTVVYSDAGEVPTRTYSTTRVGFGGAWPDPSAFRLRLVEGTGLPAWDDAARELTVALPKGATATTQLSCFVDPDDLELLGVWNWMRELFEEADDAALQQAGAGSGVVTITVDRTELTQLVLDGRHEFITPSVPLTLTHAVQQPLGHPSFTRLPIVHRPSDPIVAAALANSFSPITAWRSVGSHHAVLLGALRIDGATTAAIDLEATWTDWVDDLSRPGPEERPGSGHVDRIDLHSLDGGTLAADGSRTRDVAVYVPKIDTLWFAAPFDELDGVASPPDVAAPVHPLGDTKHRVVRYRATASSRFQEFFPEPGTVTTRTSPGLAVDVPSSARPLPPDVEYVVPTFRWEREVTTNTKTEVRLGNGLRVYMHRPWYSSGSGELLGVVLWPSASPAPTDSDREAAKGIVTQWGLDPTWQSGRIGDVPTASDFTRALRTDTSLSLQESALQVDVAGHAVSYDHDRRLWFCDIELDNSSAYAPFVRLALARYQPRSIPGIELSHVTLCDFAQLAPDRAAALTFDPADHRRARLVVAGLAPDGPTTSVLEATVEARRHDVRSDLGWAPAAPAAVQVVEDTPAPSQPASILLAATITFAQLPAPGEYRVVVREHEILEIDPPDTALGDGPKLGGRLVYAAVLPIDRGAAG